VGVADQWLERAPDSHLPYRDSCVSVVGPAVADIERAFAGVWDLNGPTLPASERPVPGEIAEAGDKAVRVVIQEPGKMRISRVLQVLAAGAERRIWIADAYFLADDVLREALIAAALDGVDVRLLLPSTNDLPLVGTLSRIGYRALIESGVRIWEYRGPMMHAKTIVADGWWSRIGSTNLNITGFLTNWEIDLIVQDPDFAALMERVFEDDLANAEELVAGVRRPSGGIPRQRPQMLARGSGPQVATTLASLSGAVVQSAALDVFREHEEKINALAGGGALVAAFVGLFFPRLLAIPLAAVLGLVGVTGIGRAIRAGRGRRQRRRDSHAAPGSSGGARPSVSNP
jgi:cardiolipin synthase